MDKRRRYCPKRVATPLHVCGVDVQYLAKLLDAGIECCFDKPSFVLPYFVQSRSTETFFSDACFEATTRQQTIQASFFRRISLATRSFSHGYLFAPVGFRKVYYPKDEDSAFLMWQVVTQAAHPSYLRICRNEASSLYVFSWQRALFAAVALVKAYGVEGINEFAAIAKLYEKKVGNNHWPLWMELRMIVELIRLAPGFQSLAELRRSCISLGGQVRTVEEHEIPDASALCALIEDSTDVKCESYDEWCKNHS